MARAGDEDLIGQRIREYLVLEFLGKGGMGAVYRGRHVYLEEDRAIKVIHKQLSDDSDFVDRFIREAKILTRLRHPNLVQLHEFGTLDEETFFMVLEFIQGESVLQRIKRLKKIPVADALKIIREAALGLSSAHQRGIIHRDISPDNLILTKEIDGTEITKVIDFGIAKPLFEASGKGLTATHLFLGKPEYCSPEQCGLLPDGELIDGRADIYSLGITLYHMLSGTLPFVASNPQAYIVKHIQETPKPVSTVVSPEIISGSVDRLILKALSKKREDRHASMEEFIQDLDDSMPTIAGNRTLPASTIQIETQQSGLRPGELFARRYLIERKLGQGGMGVVYKAIDKILEVPVALKIMNENIVHDQRTIERFKREVILARKVAHPNVCRIFDIGESMGTHYVSMEFLGGKTLADILRDQSRLSPEAGLPIVRQVLMALQEAHRAGIVHRDLKPHNIMVATDFKASIMDFGISISPDAHRLTQTGAIIGTPYYMAPEQFEARNIDHRADIYSIGIIMFQMFTGRLPFHTEVPVAIIFAHLKTEPPKPTEIVPGFSPELETIILKALQKDPQNRYQSAREFIRDIDEMIGPPSGMVNITNEQSAHKMLAEHSYSKAIKFLRTLLKKDPENPDYKKLLNIATTEKIQKDLRRARSLIKKKNLIQAQVLLEKIRRLAPEESRSVANKVQTLQLRLDVETEKTVESHLVEARRLQEKEDWTACLASLELAWNLKPNDARIVAMQEQVQVLQREKLHAKHRSQLDSANQHFSKGQSDDALGVLAEILRESPDFKPAVILQKEISDRVQKYEGFIQNARDAIANAKWQQALEASQKAMQLIPNHPTAQKLKSSAEKEIESEKRARHRLQQSLERAEDLRKAKSWAEAAALLQSARKELAGYHFSEFEQKIAGLETRIQEESNKEKARLMAIEAELMEAKKLKELQQWEDALQKIEQLLENQPSLEEAEKLRSEVRQSIEFKQTLERKLHSAVERGQQSFEEMHWEEALEAWKEAEQIVPGDRAIQEKLEDAQKKLAHESRLRDRLTTQLQQCEKAIADGDLQSAQQQMQEFQSTVAAGFRISDLVQKRETLHQQIQTEIDKEKSRKRQIQQELSQTTLLIEQRNLTKALQTVHGLLQKNPGLPEAIQLKNEIEAIQERERNVRFQQSFDRAKSLYDQKKWGDSISAFREASSIIPDPVINDWIRSAENLLQNQQKAAEEISNRLKRAEQLIHETKFIEAQEALGRIDGNILKEYALDELAARFEKLSEHVNHQIESEKARKAEIERELLEATMSFQKESYQEAMQTVQKLLAKEPASERGLQLKTQIQDAIQQREFSAQISSKLAEVVRFLELEKYNELSSAVQQLQKSAKNSRYQSDTDGIAKSLIDAAASLKNKDYDRARNLLQVLISQSVLMRPFYERLEQIRTRLATYEVKQKLSSVTMETQRLVQNGRWQDAISAGESFIQTNSTLLSPTELQPLRDQIARAEQSRSQSEIVPPTRTPEPSGVRQTVASVDKKKRQLQMVAVALLVPITAVVLWLLFRTDPNVVRSAELLQAGQKLYTQGEYQKAEELLSAATTLDPQNQQAQQMLNETRHQLQLKKLMSDARALFKASRFEESRAILQDLLKLDAGNGEAKELLSQLDAKARPQNTLVSSALTFLSQGQTDRALATLRQAVKKDPTDEQAKQLLSRTLFDLARKQTAAGQFTQAQNSLTESLKIDPTSADARNLLSEISNKAKAEQMMTTARNQLKAGQYEQARSSLRQILDQDPQNAEARKLISEANEKSGLADRKAQLKNLLDRSRVLIKQNKLNEAKTELNKALHLDPANPTTNALLKEIEQKQKTVAQPPPPAGPRYGEISIQCEPFGTVFIDGKEIGPSPIPRRKIEAGKHTLEIRRQGFRTIKETLQVPEGEAVNRYYTLEKQ